MAFYFHLASRSMFDGFVDEHGTESDVVNGFVNSNRLISEYAKACRDELEYGCVFATLSADDKVGCQIKFHSPANAAALKTIILMAQAIARNVSLDDLTDEEKDIVAHFKNPAMPSVAVTADAAIKIASARENFAGTDTFLEMIGFD